MDSSCWHLDLFRVSLRRQAAFPAERWECHVTLYVYGSVYIPKLIKQKTRRLRDPTGNSCTVQLSAENFIGVVLQAWGLLSQTLSPSSSLIAQQDPQYPFTLEFTSGMFILWIHPLRSNLNVTSYMQISSRYVCYSCLLSHHCTQQ